MTTLRQSSIEHFNLTSKQQTKSMANALELMANTIPDQVQRKEWIEKTAKPFSSLFDSYLKTRHETVEWDKIQPPDANIIIPRAKLPKIERERKVALAEKLCVLKLNGGLGTSMGCVGPKSMIEVRAHQTFLDLIVKQIQYLNRELGVDVPFLLMNSFNTHEDTIKLIEKYSMNQVSIFTFNQSQFPRIVRDTLLPLPKDAVSNLEDWYPPGHGDIYPSLVNSGLLDKLIESGKEYLFISNVDNLAATVDFDILAHMEETKAEFLMEVTDKSRADIKGGTLITYNDKVKLLEIAQVPKQYLPDFQSIKKFKIFNTNNLWVNLKAIKRVVQQNALCDIDIIANPKVVEGVPIIQLETAAGAAIQFFQNAHGINVPRSRFLPVKNTSDLFLIQSDLYSVKSGTLIVNPNRPFPTVPIVKLGDKFKYVSDYNKRLGGKVNLLELDQLTISGDVTVGRDVVLKGTVIIVANDGCRIDIPNGSVLEDKVVTGNLRILDH